MKTYEKYKNSGVSWLGKIPEHWKITKIKKKCKLIGSGTTPETSNESYYNGNIHWIQSGDLYHKDLITSTEKLITEFALNNCRALSLYQPPFIVVAMYGASIGNTSMVNIPACVNQACCVLKPCEDVNIRYMHYYIKSCKEDFLSQSAGGSQPNINQQKIREETFLFPPLAEQEAIVKFLDYKVSRIENLIIIRQAQIVKLKELKKVVINKAVTKNNWKRVRLKRLFKVFSGATPKSDNPQYWDGNIIWITPADFQTQDKYIYDGAKNITSAGFKSCSTSLIPVGSIIFSKRAPVGKVAINKVALCTNQGCLSCVPLENISSEFFYYVMSICQEEFEKEAAGTTFKEISLTAFANFLLPAPPIAEQNEIAKYLDKKCTQIDKLITIREKQITELNELKARLISDVVTGKIDVR